MKSFLLVLAALLPIAACAATANLSWTAVTTATDGSTLTGVTYSVYQGTQPTTGACAATNLAKVASALTATTDSIVVTSKAGTTQCFAVTASANGVESALSNIATAAVPFPTPSAPGQITVVVTP